MNARAVTLCAAFTIATLATAHAQPGVEFTVDERRLRLDLVDQGADYRGIEWLPESVKHGVYDEGLNLRAEGSFLFTVRLRTDDRGVSPVVPDEAETARVDLPLGEATPQRIEVQADVQSLELRLFDMAAVPDDSAAFDVTFLGSVRALHGGGGWQGLLKLATVRIRLRMYPKSVQAKLRAAIELGQGRLEAATLAAGDGLLPYSQHGISSLLRNPTPELEAAEQEQQVELARGYLATGDLYRAQVALSRGRWQPGAEPLLQVLAGKKGIQDQLLAKTQEHRDFGTLGSYVRARRLLEGFIQLEAWSANSPLRLEEVRVLLAEGNLFTARHRLNQLGTMEPRMVTDAAFLALQERLFRHWHTTAEPAPPEAGENTTIERSSESEAPASATYPTEILGHKTFSERRSLRPLYFCEVQGLPIEDETQRTLRVTLGISKHREVGKEIRYAVRMLRVAERNGNPESDDPSPFVEVAIETVYITRRGVMKTRANLLSLFNHKKRSRVGLVHVKNRIWQMSLSLDAETRAGTFRYSFWKDHMGPLYQPSSRRQLLVHRDISG